MFIIIFEATISVEELSFIFSKIWLMYFLIALPKRLEVFKEIYGIALKYYEKRPQQRCHSVDQVHKIMVKYYDKDIIKIS